MIRGLQPAGPGLVSSCPCFIKLQQVGPPGRRERPAGQSTGGRCILDLVEVVVDTVLIDDDETDILVTEVVTWIVVANFHASGIESANGADVGILTRHRNATGRAGEAVTRGQRVGGTARLPRPGRR